MPDNESMGSVFFNCSFAISFPPHPAVHPPFWSINGHLEEIKCVSLDVTVAMFWVSRFCLIKSSRASDGNEF